MPKGILRLVCFLPVLWAGLYTGIAVADIILVPPDVNLREGDRIVEISWHDPDPQSLVALPAPTLGTPQYAWRGMAKPTVAGFYLGACDWDLNITVSAGADSVVFSWLEVKDWKTKITRQRHLRIDETDFYYDLSYGIKLSVPSADLFEYNLAGWDGPEPSFHGIYRGGAYPDTSVLFDFECLSGGSLSTDQDAAITLHWVAPNLGQSGTVVLTRAGQSVEVSAGLMLFFPAGEFRSGETFSVGAKIPFGKVGPGGDPPSDGFKVRGLTFDGYLVLRRSVADRRTPSDTMYEVVADIKRCDTPEFFADAAGNQDPYGERYLADKGVHGQGTGVTPDTTDRVIVNGFPYEYAVVTYDWSSQYQLVMSPIMWTKVYPAPVGANTADGVYVAPNPYRFHTAWEEGDAKLQFLNVPQGATIKIFDASGEFIDTVTPNRKLDGTQTSTADWNLRDSDGKQVVSGIYIYRVESGRGNKVGRFIVVR